MISTLKEVNAVITYEAHDAINICQVTRPRTCQSVLEGFWPANAAKWVAQSLFYYPERTKSGIMVGLGPEC